MVLVECLYTIIIEEVLLKFHPWFLLMVHKTCGRRSRLYWLPYWGAQILWACGHQVWLPYVGSLVHWSCDHWVWLPWVGSLVHWSCGNWVRLPYQGTLVHWFCGYWVHCTTRHRGGIKLVGLLEISKYFLFSFFHSWFSVECL